jgi:hypothetical protein
MIRLSHAVLAASLLAGGHPVRSQTPQAAPRGLNQLSPDEQRDGWRLLWDGKTFTGWRGLGYDTVPTKHWVIEDGAIKKVASGKIARRPDGLPVAGGDLMTVVTFKDFELSWEWKVAPGSNSGLKYNVSEELSTGVPATQLRPATGQADAKGISHSAIGFEYQMIDDDRHPDGKLVKHKTADLYDIFSSNEKKHVKPVGEWNQSRVVFRGKHGEHWLNGEKVVEYELGSPEMNAAIAASKFKTLPWFGERRTGHIVLQDHGDEVYFRNIKIREIGGSQ